MYYIIFIFLILQLQTTDAFDASEELLNYRDESSEEGLQDFFVPPEISVCGEFDADAAGASDSRLFPLYSQSFYRPEHVVALPDKHETTEITLFGNSSESLPQRIRCALRVETCPDCLLKVEFTDAKTFLNAKEIKLLSECTDAPAEPCLDVRVVEDKADSAFDVIYTSTSLPHAHQPIIISTSTSIRIIASLWNIEKNSSYYNYLLHLFPLKVSVISNAEHVIGRPSESILQINQTSVGFIQSPRYPAAYPRNVEKTYTLENNDPNGYIRLIFDDFHLHFQSELTIYDSDGAEIANSRKDQRRPAAIVSSGNTLTIHFNARDFTQIVGFRARYEFVDDQEWPERPNGRDCDGVLEGYGGEITLEGGQHLINTQIDCIWVIGRLPALKRTFDRIHLKVEEFALKGVGMRLEIREGPSSVSDRLLLLFDTQTSEQLEHKQPRHGFSTSLSSPAYYVRLRGFLMGNSGLEIVYAQFYRWATALCPGVSEWHCDNGRCIKSLLRCDGIDHCGDESDEECVRIDHGTSPARNSPDIASVMGLFVGICALILLVVSATALGSKIYRRRLELRMADAMSASQPQSPNDGGANLHTVHNVGNRRFFVMPDQNISVVEAPPTYDDALKHPVAIPRSPAAYVNASFSQEDAEIGMEEIRLEDDRTQPNWVHAQNEENCEDQELTHRSTRSLSLVPCDLKSIMKPPQEEGPKPEPKTLSVAEVLEELNVDVPTSSGELAQVPIEESEDMTSARASSTTEEEATSTQQTEDSTPEEATNLSNDRSVSTTKIDSDSDSKNESPRDPVEDAGSWV